MIDLGRIDSQTKPVNKLVTAKPSANRSALDCELQSEKDKFYKPRFLMRRSYINLESCDFQTV